MTAHRPVIAALAFVLSGGCLPEDTRPPPSEVLVRFVGSRVVTDGFETTDGWRIAFDQVLVSFGRPTLVGDDCNSYVEAGYSRIFDASVTEPQKVALDFGRGTCGLEVRFGNPSGDSLLGANVTGAQKLFMRTPAEDVYSPDGAGISAYLVGHAQKGAVSKRFSFAWRTRYVPLRDCAKAPGDGPTQLALDGASMTVDFHAHPEGPFRQHLDATRPELWFAPFAAADDEGDADGEVTLAELHAKQLDSVAGLLPDDLVPKGSGLTRSPFTTLADYVWIGTFPKLATYGSDGPCRAPLSPFEEEDDGP
ncbi:MAG: hypothetical protein IPJ34_42155 [Myxococcales bacterium]|nr:hypothetical protein [Myxococcales bacterium]